MTPAVPDHDLVQYVADHKFDMTNMWKKVQTFPGTLVSAHEYEAVHRWPHGNNLMVTSDWGDDDDMVEDDHSHHGGHHYNYD